MDVSRLPQQWQDAFRRDRVQPPPMTDPRPERRLARMLAAFVSIGLVYMVLPGTVLGVWNLIGISSRQQLAAVPAAWIQAHGHAQFFGWVGTFVIGISLYTLPKFRGSICRSIPLAWAMWAMWSIGVGLRWLAGIQSGIHRWEFLAAALLEFAVASLLIWQVTPSGASRRKAQTPAWETPIFGGLAALVFLLAWQTWLSFGPLKSAALPAEPDRLLISLAIWAFAFPVAVGYSAKFFPGLLGAEPPHARGLQATLFLILIATSAAALEAHIPGASATLAASWSAIWSLRIFHASRGNPKTSGVYHRYPRFTRVAYLWLLISALLGFAAQKPGMLGASRHAFTVGFLATLIFSIGPRILPSFLNSRELWSPRLMQASLVLITTGCFLRVLCEPLAYGGIIDAAWKVLPLSAIVELMAVLFFALNLAMSLAAPVPSWFGRAHVNDGMSVYWLIGSYPATHRLLVESGVTTLAVAPTVPKSLTLREAAEAEGISPKMLVGKLGDFFESRLAPSLRKQA